MREIINFTKMHAVANDFVIIDRIRQSCKIQPAVIQAIANRHTGVGCDQVLVLDPPSDPTYDFEYRIFNQDGNEVEQCGNGARCVGRYLYQKGLTNKKLIRLHSQAGGVKVDVHNIQHIKAHLGKPIFESKQLSLNHVELIESNRYKIKLGETQKEISFVSIGNPHGVIFVPSLNDDTLSMQASACQNHPAFPDSLNVIFVHVLAKNHIRCRVFERHCGETQACGSGACAAVIAGILKNEVNAAVQVDMPGGQLDVEWHGDEVMLSGETCASFEGHFSLNEEWL